MSVHTPLPTLIVYVLMCIFPALLGAEEVKVNGFVAQGLIQAKDSNFVNDDGNVSAELTEVGVNASYRVSSKLRVAGQGVYLNGGNRYHEGVRLDYLFLDWQVVNTLDWQVNFYLGRNKNYHWLYSSTRDVPHTRPSIILPQSIYFDGFRDIALGSDGVAFLTSTSNQLGDWDINWSYGKTNISREQTINLFGKGASGNIDHRFEHQFSVQWKPFASHYQLGIGLLDSEFNYEEGEQDILGDGSARTQRLMFTFAYYSERWDITSGLMKERVKFKDTLFVGFSSDVFAEGGYAQARYNVFQDVNLLARLDLFDRDRDDRSGQNLEALTGGRVPAYFAFMDQATLGLSWNFAANMKIQAEIHRVKGAGRLAPVLNPNVALNNHKYWNIWAVQLMYWF